MKQSNPQPTRSRFLSTAGAACGIVQYIPVAVNVYKVICDASQLSVMIR